MARARNGWARSTEFQLTTRKKCRLIGGIFLGSEKISRISPLTVTVKE
jgi:hypothetical protein